MIGTVSDSRHVVRDRLMAKDFLGAHARDELGISEISTARPIQAALTSAVTFTVGAALSWRQVVSIGRTIFERYRSRAPRLPDRGHGSDVGQIGGGLESRCHDRSGDGYPLVQYFHAFKCNGG